MKGAVPDLLVAHGPRFLHHVNVEHPRALREAAARLLGVPVHAVAAAGLTGLDDRGADGWAVDATGAHELRLAFPEPVATVEALGRSLRDHLS